MASPKITATTLLRNAARDRGEKTFAPATTCERGHACHWWSEGGCIVCAHARRTARHEADPSKRKAWARNQREAHGQENAARSQRWRSEHRLRFNAVARAR